MPRSAEVDRAIMERPPRTQQHLQELRSLIHRTADESGAGPLMEALKWGQPAFLTEETKSGSTVRIDATKRDGEAAIYFICHTGLVEEFRERFDGDLRFEGNRAILVAHDDAVDEAKLVHCIARALTYKRDRAET